MDFLSLGLLLVLISITFQDSTKGQNLKTEACGGKPSDVIFVLDSSSSIQYRDFQKEINFTREVVQMFDIGPNKTQVGVISYSTTVVPELKLGELSTKDEILDKIKNVEFLGGNTNTGEALNYIREKAFPNKKSPYNSTKPRIAIILTDGQSNDVHRTMAEASKAKTEGISLFVIGIGKQIDQAELEAIASTPLDTYMFTVGNFDALDSIKDQLAISACEVKMPQTTQAVPNEPMMNDDVVDEVLYGEGQCHPQKPISMAYAVDTSSIGAENAYYVMILINRIASRLQMDKQPMSLSVVTSGCGLHSTKNSLVDHVHDQKTLQNGLEAMTTNTFQSLFRDMRQKIQADKKKKVGIIFLNRQLSKDEYHKSELESRRSKFKQIEIFIVGIGSRFDESQATGLTMTKDHYLRAESYDKLYEIEGPLLYRICKVK